MKNLSDHSRGLRIQTRFIISALLLALQLLFLFTVLYNLTARSAVLYTISFIAGTVVVIFIVNRRGNPSHKIMWIIFILIFPIFGISVFLLWGGGRVLPHIKRRMEKCEKRYLPYLKQNDPLSSLKENEDFPHARQARYLTRESGYPLYSDTSVEYFSPIEDFFPRLLRELDLAERYIYIEFFIIGEGVMWDKIHEILKKKAQAGVEVKIIFDDFGSIKRQHENFITNLRSEKIDVSIFNPIGPSMNIFMNNRNHRKIIIIDGKTAMTGGFNIGDEYINLISRFGYWLDSAVLLKGAAVRSFLVMFCCMWEFTTGKPIPIGQRFSDSREEPDGYVLPYCDDPLHNKNPGEGIYMQIINSAKDYVYIASPYLIIDHTMISSLLMAAKSGVDVRIITPHIPDKWYVHPVTQYNYQELLEGGVKIYEYTPGFIHSKLFVSDDSVGTVGTINMDYRSFIFHFECGVWMSGSSAIADVRSQFEKLFRSSQEIKLRQWKKRPLFLRFKQAFLHIFAPFL